MAAAAPVLPLEPWQGALTVLEEYAQAMRMTSFTDCEEICFRHASRLAQAAQRLPHNAPGRLLPGDAAGSGGAEKPAETKDLPNALPKSAPAMVRNLLRNLEPTMRCEALLAPEPFNSSAQKGAVLVAAESWACELGELLQSAPEWTVRQHGEWALCSSLERFSAFLRWLTGIATRSCSELSGASASTSALEEHSLCLRSIARVVAKMSSYMQGALGAMDPARPLTGRLGQVAEGLEEAADDLAQKAARLLQKGKHGKAAPDTSKSVTAGELRESQRRSILGLLAGHPNWQLPHEVQRQESLLQHLQEQREGGSGAARTQGMQDRRPRTTVLAFGASRARAEAQAQADFAELDQNKDGVVSIDEWRRARVPAQR
ncbi:unnamed protein product [Durusdinium trenchii]|uniref:Uncharacterized protein n=2 Tax=Durusdinium trenchii TaxID=1381693 RepID=A0ABP0N1U3_9DINO